MSALDQFIAGFREGWQSLSPRDSERLSALAVLLGGAAAIVWLLD